MKLTLILGVLVLTAATFFAAIQTIGAAGAASQTAIVSEQLETATAELDATRADFDQQAAALNRTIADLNAENLEKAAAVEAAVAERDQLQAQLEEANGQLDIATAENATLATGNEDLTQELAGLIASIESDESASREAETTIQSLNDVIAEGRAEIQTLQAKVSELESESAGLTQQLAELESDAAAPAETADVAAQLQTIAELTEETTSLEEQVATLIAEASNLSEEVGKRDTVIAGLMERTQTADTTPLAECQARTDTALAATQVSFEGGSATLTAASIPLLEELAAIAAECAQADLTLEIEGHTGDTGGNASNLLLSDGRAKAVRDFLLESGVPAPSVRAVGFGGSEAVAGGENDRVIFDWEQS